MTNTDDDNLAESQETYRKYLADTYGDDVLVGLATDEPARNTTGKLIETRRRQDRQDAAHEQGLLTLQQDARERREDLALERARTMIDAGQTPDLATALLAARAQERQGGSGLSSAQRLAAPSLARLHREQGQNDDNDRRQGRRPRG
jgi:hypothetical protein